MGERSERSHAGTAYLDPVAKRDNFYVLTGAHVEKILFAKDGDQKYTAIGVIYRKDREVREVEVGREVVLAAGAFGSPRILELSGFGNKKILEPLGITQLCENTAIGGKSRSC